MSNDLKLRPDPAALNALLRQSECLVDRETMQAAYDRMAREMTATLADACPVVIVVMTGGLVVAGQLLSRLTFPLEIDYIHVSRYRGTQGGALNWHVRPTRDLTGRTVVLVDDLFDQGLTLAAVRGWCQNAGAARTWLAVGALKQLPARAVDLLPEFVGVHLPDRFVFGEGLDYDGFFRNLPGIHALPEQTMTQE
ncbi:hypoxanthine-guanine phosphoribosyltransferase [Halothiobacillus sp. DCM-1]|uniref:hypoxanthine-guanine phosphoribosyltransferase n=1 Tax=Halothiobacillus sp. DCM-1 TaxID=3112558 RepID=UPI003247FA72